jgi:DNA-binding NarL/FixJ family response regulator
VLIADDHEDVLDDIRDLLEPEFDVVGTVGDGEALLSAAESLRPDVIVTDISMPRMNGIEAAREIIQRDPSSKIILMTVHKDPALVRQGFTAGVLGYVLKMKASHELSRAVYEVLQGNRYVSPLVED